jgi:saccharopine dehydrogenase-like NADP-dependent oxidoreductase
MKRIVVLGSGRSSWYLLKYLCEKAREKGWFVLVCDRDEKALLTHTQGLFLERQVCDISDVAVLTQLIQGSSVVVSLLPPVMHFSVAKICLECGVHLATASYVSEDMAGLHNEASEKGLIFLNEMGLDPGIDHMSAMKVMDQIREKGGEIVTFESYCGGLILEEDCKGNPWGYKFSWNPRNVVLAGQGGMSIFRENGNTRCIPWHRLFAEAGQLEIPGLGRFDAYANRDSLGYTNVYGLQNAATILRGTLRRNGFCRAWQVLVKLGYTDAITVLPEPIGSIGALSQALTGRPDEETTANWLKKNGVVDEEMREKFEFLDMDDMQQRNLGRTSADVLQEHLMQKWLLNPNDRDEVIMYHRIGFTEGNRLKTHHSVLRVIGKDALHTAMAKTVGLPLAIGVEMILSGDCPETGVVIPVKAYWYGHVLKELEGQGIVFEESIN